MQMDQQSTPAEKHAVSEKHRHLDDRERLTTTVVDLVIRLGILALLLYWSFVLVQPFIPIALWAVVLTVALYPVYEWIAQRLGGRRRVAAVLITVLSLLVVIGPVLWLTLSLVESVRTLSQD